MTEPNDPNAVELLPEAVTLAECPPGLFMFNGTFGFKTEYGMSLVDENGSEMPGHLVRFKITRWPDAYVVESGECFWGGATSHEERAALLVSPATLRAPVAGKASELADRIEAAIERFHDALPQGQGDIGDGGDAGRALCQLFYDESEAICAALRRPPAITEEAIEAVARALYDCEADRSAHADKVFAAARGQPLGQPSIEPYELCADTFRSDAHAAIAALSSSPVTTPGADRNAVLDEAAAVAENWVPPEGIDPRDFTIDEAGPLIADAIRSLKSDPVADNGGEAG